MAVQKARGYDEINHYRFRRLCQFTETNLLITHLEEDWGKSYEDYLELQKQYEGIEFAYDGLKIDY